MGKIIGLLLVLSYISLETSSLTLPLIVPQSYIFLSKQRIIALYAVSFASSIRASFSLTNTKPLETTSGPDTRSPETESSVATTMGYPKVNSLAGQRFCRLRFVQPQAYPVTFAKQWRSLLQCCKTLIFRCKSGGWCFFYAVHAWIAVSVVNL